MKRLRKLLRRPTAVMLQAKGRAPQALTRPAARLRQGVNFKKAESNLRAKLVQDPNDPQVFAALAELIRKQAAYGHEDAERRSRGVADAEWALAEELAQNPKAWYPLVELGRLSLEQDPEGAHKRLTMATVRDPSGRALAEVLAMLRREGKPEVALALGVGHWRPREHVPGAGRELVRAAAEAGRIAEARRHLDALAEHPDADVIDLRDQLDRLARGSSHH